MIVWNDVFVSLWVGGQDKWSILPQWKDHVKKMKQYKGEL